MSEEYDEMVLDWEEVKDWLYSEFYNAFVYCRDGSGSVDSMGTEMLQIMQMLELVEKRVG